jgi:hypothetical protein|tara:strand:+ start:334 stop:558 length:225 start_codon:yes stop_codon:yes gene_type:complete
MKTSKELKQSLYQITEEQVVNLGWIKKEIEIIEKDKNINEINFKKVSNIMNELNVLREFYIEKLFWALKQNHKL